MKITKKNGEVLNDIYVTDDRWFEDLDYFMDSSFVYEVVQDCEIGLMEIVSSHLIYWLNDYMNDEKNAELTKSKIKENETLKRLCAIDDFTQPELIIYEFGGKSIYDDIDSDKIRYGVEDKLIIIALPDDAVLLMSLEEFENNGGSIDFPDEDEDEEIDFYYSAGNVFFFMTDEKLIIMKNYLYDCVLELNTIYESLGLQKINIV